MDPLDNPAWHALTGPQSTVAEGVPPAVRFATDVSPFAGLPDEVTPDAWDALADLVGPGGTALLCRTAVDAPGAWEEAFRAPGVQMVAEDVAGMTAPGAEVLGPADVADMMALVARARPGPFRERTIELGDYIGIRDDGVLVAMAGQRLRIPGHTEISTVCTDDAHRGKGLATALVRDLVARITAGGATPILHAAADNVNAIRLYRELGFVTRARLDFVVARAPGA